MARALQYYVYMLWLCYIVSAFAIELKPIYSKNVLLENITADADILSFERPRSRSFCISFFLSFYLHLFVSLSLPLKTSLSRCTTENLSIGKFKTQHFSYACINLIMMSFDRRLFYARNVCWCFVCEFVFNSYFRGAFFPSSSFKKFVLFLLLLLS